MNLLEILGLIFIGIVVLAFIMAIPVVIYETYGSDIKKYFKEKRNKNFKEKRNKNFKGIIKMTDSIFWEGNMDKHLDNNFRAVYNNYILKNWKKILSRK